MTELKEQNEKFRELFPSENEEETYKERYGEDVDIKKAKEMEDDENFQKVIKKSFKEEAGYVDDPDDEGEETNMGISKMSHPNENIKEITTDKAKLIYYDEYYKRPGIDKLPEDFQSPTFDTGIRRGPYRTIAIIQDELGEEPDGLIGDKTIESAESVTDKCDLGERLFERFNQEDDESIRKTPVKQKYKKGWTDRNERNWIDNFCF